MAWNPYGEDFLGDKQLSQVLRKRRILPPKLYQVEDVVGEEDRGGHVWENPELEAYLHHYREATTLGRGGTQEEVPQSLQYLKTTIFTALGEGSHRAGQYTIKASLTIPFPRADFDKHFRPLTIVGWIAGGLRATRDVLLPPIRTQPSARQRMATETTQVILYHPGDGGSCHLGLQACGDTASGPRMADPFSEKGSREHHPPKKVQSMSMCKHSIFEERRSQSHK
ncbi:hypothetical protein Bbelb_344160 [Branchiostoma belcheri]|nr:hypothetical protein Bbelb_344160 [Branchiostoma belcheri]